jgi:hypothetical protein
MIYISVYIFYNINEYNIIFYIKYFAKKYKKKNIYITLIINL